MSVDVKGIGERVKEASGFVDTLYAQMEKAIIGQRRMLERLMIGLLTGGHVLMEGVPGLAKTTAIKTLASALSMSFRRIQFTPDLLPADLVGTMIYSPKDGAFSTRKGPIFANVILADEINRAPAKVQSALLEAMQELQVTIGDNTFPLPVPFLVLATQNPIEQEGTYPLPEAQVDRFMLKVLVDYPAKSDERRIMDLVTEGGAATIEPVVSAEEILAAREVARSIYMDDKIKDYIIEIVLATRDPKAAGLDLAPYIQYGASPRASISLNFAARAQAFLDCRGYVTPQDVKSTALDVIRHRLILSYEAEAAEKTADDIIQQILDHIEVP